MQLKNKNELSPCQVELEIEIGADEVGTAIDKAYREYSTVYNIPGFRKGKAPKALLERYIPEDRVKERAAEDILPTAIASAIDEAGVEPYARPEVDIIQFEKGSPLIVKAKVPLPPKVELGDYKGIEVERLAQVISDEQIDEEIENLRNRTATYEIVTDRAVQTGDKVTVEMHDEGDESKEPDIRPVYVGENLPSFDEGLAGMKITEEKVIDVSYPEDGPSEELKGSIKKIKTKIIGIEEKKMPELNDEWAKSVGEKLGESEIETLDQLKTNIREQMEKSAQTAADRQVETNIVNKIIENSSPCYPDIMMEHEVAHRLQNMMDELKRLGSTIEDYLARSDRSFEQFREEMETAADRDLKIALVLYEIAEKEGIKVEDEDVDQEIQRLADERGVPIESFRAYVEKTEAKEGIEERLFRRRTLDFLVENSNIKNVGQ